MPENKKAITLDVQMTEVVNYALQQNRIPIIQEIVIRNEMEFDLSGALLRIWSEPEMTASLEQGIDSVSAGTAFSMKNVPLSAKAEFLAGLTERITGELHIALERDGEILTEVNREMVALAFDEWHGSAFFPELLAAFVTPNHPEVIKINARAAELLEKWSGDPSLNAYQTQDPNRVRMQAAAVYGSLQAQNIVYSVPPASFEAIGQRVRLCGDVIQQKMGTCLDLTLLYASCLEAIGLHPLLILQKGHAFAGVWLEDLSFSEAVQDDPSLITKRLADGVGEIAVIECTAMVSGKSVDFDAASELALHTLSGESPLEYIVDVSRARFSGIRPLPLRVYQENGWYIEKEQCNEDELTTAPTALGEKIQVTEGGTVPANGKLANWERKLLDLSLRNTLINMRLSQTVIPILSASLGDLEDALSDGSEYGIGPRPTEWAMKGENQSRFESISDLGPFKELIKSEFHNKRLRSVFGEGELARAIVNLYRSSRVSLEENGANTLYLALGLLRWYESRASQRARYAPIVLLPVEIIRKSANKGYVIRLRDEDPQMNITLLEMLKQDFGITVGGLDPLPLDEHGSDIRTIFTILRRAVMDQPRWDIIESAYLGTFSFSQFVMWNDVRNRAEDLQRNKIVRSLIDGKLAWEAVPLELEERVDGDDVLLPIPADASQLLAIRSAVNGESFVLHGPPGTGKSQTITALISNALAQGKRVLFVAEKMAALSVVQRRLTAIGIAPFCLELHSNKSKKRDVLDQLRVASEVVKLTPPEEYAGRAEQAAQLRWELDAYVQSLHQRRKSGLSLFEMVCGYESSCTAENSICFSADFGNKADAELLRQQELLVERLIAAAKAVGHPSGHPLRYVTKRDYSQQLRSMLPEQLSAYRAALNDLKAVGKVLAGQLDMPAPVSFRDWERLGTVSKELAVWFSIPRAWAKKEHLNEGMNGIRAMAAHYEASAALCQTLLEDWSEDFLQQSGETLKSQWDTVSVKWFLPKLLGQNRLIKSVTAYTKNGVKKEALGTAFQTLVKYQQEKAAGDALFACYGDDLGGLFSGDNIDDWGRIASLASEAKRSASALDELTNGDTLRRTYASHQELFSSIKSMNQAVDAAFSSRDALYASLEIQTEPAEQRPWMEGEQQLISDLERHASELREWMLWNTVVQEAWECALEPLVHAYENGLAHDKVMGSYHKALYTALINHTIDSDETLNKFSGALFNEKIEQFRRLDQEISELARSEIFCRLASRIPNLAKEAAQSSEVGILQRAIRSGGRGLSIRRLFEQIPNLLSRLCPCMLMSPISAAQYLDPKHTPFDIVVFDEASQLPTHKAVGALARGESAVIVGDPNQMPPTSFFSGNTIDEDNLENEDLESILDDCLALNLPQTHLLWHYRSRHESLIAFSNSRFYENKLCTFPSVNDRESKVSLVPVEGFFDRGGTRQNRGEAEAIVRELIRRCHQPDCAAQSVGVVTFNITQQNLIDDLLTEACKTDPQLESWAYEAEEPLFIKNLENVQGDERDVILFSVVYGLDLQGKVTMNFGPLNREGGWRRLNVAVSRARHEMIVFSIMTPDQIDLSRTSAEGVAALKAFLEYAGGTALPDTAAMAFTRSGRKESIADGICKALSQHGYVTQKTVGTSKYRVDVGVVDPKNPEQYLLGVLLDGESYFGAKTTRDREISQISILRGLGWNIHRIWTVDWWDNSRREIDRLLTLLKELEQQPANPTPAVEKPLVPKPFPEVVPISSSKLASGISTSNVSLIPPIKFYQAAVLPRQNLSSEEFLLPQHTRCIQELIFCILEAEAPITEGLLTRRLLQSFDISRAGSRLQARISELLTIMGVSYTIQGEQKVYWKEGQNPDAYHEFRANGTEENKRDAKEIPVHEAANATCAVLEEQIGLPREDLLRETAKLLGYARMGNLVVAAMSDGLDFAMAQKRICADQYGYLTLPR